MPLDPLTINTGLSVLGLAGQAFNVGQQQHTNEQAIAQTWKMYERQRQDALTDWNRQNTYNSPQQQMERLRQAGVHPMVAFGKGAENASSVIRSSQSSPPSLTAPRADIMPSLGMAKMGLQDYFSLKQMQAQTDNTAAHTAVLEQQARNEAVREIGMLIGNKDANFSLEQKQRLADTAYEMAVHQLAGQKYENIKKQVETDIALDENERQKLSNSANVAKTLQEIINLKAQASKIPYEKAALQAQTLNANQQQELNRYAIQLEKQGIPKGSNAWTRAIMKVWNKLVEDGKKFGGF